MSVLCRVHAHRCYPNAILKCDIANLEGSEERRWVIGESCSCWGILGGGKVRSVGCWLVSGYGYRAHCDSRYIDILIYA
jgi:hypothetical protein